MIVATGRNTRHVKWVSFLINCLSSSSSWFNFFSTQHYFYSISSSNISVLSPLWSSRSTRTKWIPPTMSPEGCQYFESYIAANAKCRTLIFIWSLISCILKTIINAGRVRKTPLVVGLQWTWETRLTYNCAHLRSTKESLTDSVKKNFVRKFFWVKICWVNIFWVNIFFWVKFFGWKFFWVNFWVKIFWVNFFF